MVASAPLSLSPSRRAWLRFKPQPPGLLEPGGLLHAGGAEFVRRAGQQRPAAGCALRGQTYFPMLKDYPETTFGGDFLTPTDYPRSVHPTKIQPRQQLGAPAPSQPLRPEHAELLLLRRPTRQRPHARTGWARMTGRDLLAQLICTVPGERAVRAGAHRHGRAVGCGHGRHPGVLWRQD